jgi:hypothetical protein
MALSHLKRYSKIGSPIFLMLYVLEKDDGLSKKSICGVLPRHALLTYVYMPPRQQGSQPIHIWSFCSSRDKSWQ